MSKKSFSFLRLPEDFRPSRDEVLLLLIVVVVATFLVVST
jgi:hypothetical protein